MRPAAFAVVSSLLLSPAAIAQSADSTIAYSGRLELDGDPVEVPRALRFGLFPSSGSDATCLVSTGNCSLWFEEHASVLPVKGNFSVVLGELTPISPGQREISATTNTVKTARIWAAVHSPRKTHERTWSSRRQTHPTATSTSTAPTGPTPWGPQGRSPQETTS